MAAPAASPRLQHVSVPIPPGGEESARLFYGGVLGLREKPAPEVLRGDVLWFELLGDGEPELHLLVDPAHTRSPDDGGHFCLVVGDLDAWRARLEAAGLTIRDGSRIVNRPRFFVHDPFANLIEFATIEGPYA